LDLSAPHNNKLHSSINDLINKEDYSLTYVKLDDVIKIVKSLGVKASLSKRDVSDAFKNSPLNPVTWHLFGFKWEDKYYFYTRLCFGCRSSPKIFDQLSVAICWILLNNYYMKHVLHLLDDFLVIDEPSFNAEITMQRLLNLMCLEN
jgi:hypothetical protein